MYKAELLKIPSNMISLPTVGLQTVGISVERYVVEEVTLLYDDSDEVWLDDGDTITMTERRRA